MASNAQRPIAPRQGPGATGSEQKSGCPAAPAVPPAPPEDVPPSSSTFRSDDPPHAATDPYASIAASAPEAKRLATSATAAQSDAVRPAWRARNVRPQSLSQALDPCPRSVSGTVTGTGTVSETGTEMVSRSLPSTLHAVSSGIVPSLSRSQLVALGVEIEFDVSWILDCRSRCHPRRSGATTLRTERSVSEPGESQYPMTVQRLCLA